MRKALVFVFVILLAMGGGYYWFIKWNNCSLPRNFSIGDIDTRFNISRAEVQNLAQDASDRWNKQSGNPLLSYSQTAKLKINLVYDYRQADLDNLKRTLNSVKTDQSSVENWKTQYQNALNKYQQDLAAYNAEVSGWNSRGGAPQDVYLKLQQEKTALEEERNNLNKLGNLVNLQIDNYNSNLNDLNQQINARQSLIVTQGVYDSSSDQINIYTYGDKDELRLVLMHELGHSLGLDHTANHLDIMYSILGDQNLKDPYPTSGDIDALKMTCNLKTSHISIFEIINWIKGSSFSGS